MALLFGIAAPAKDPAAMVNVVVYKESGRFGGWPANHGIWSWGNEIVVGFSLGYFQKVPSPRVAWCTKTGTATRSATPANRAFLRLSAAGLL
jgi:hypothetical protein